MKLNTTWHENGKVWYYFTTPQEAQVARLEGVVFHAALGVWRSIAAYARKSCGTETVTHTPECDRAPGTNETILFEATQTQSPQETPTHVSRTPLEKSGGYHPANERPRKCFHSHTAGTGSPSQHGPGSHRLRLR